MSDAPDRGDLVWVDFTPQASHEKAGHRPALVVSPRIYHERSHLAVVCPITSNVDPWPWKVELANDTTISGAILVDQVRSIDRAIRRLRVAGQVSSATMAEVQAKLAALLGILALDR